MQNRRHRRRRPSNPAKPGNLRFYAPLDSLPSPPRRFEFPCLLRPWAAQTLAFGYGEGAATPTCPKRRHPLLFWPPLPALAPPLLIPSVVVLHSRLRTPRRLRLGILRRISPPRHPRTPTRVRLWNPIRHGPVPRRGSLTPASPAASPRRTHVLLLLRIDHELLPRTPAQPHRLGLPLTRAALRQAAWSITEQLCSDMISDRAVILLTHKLAFPSLILFGRHGCPAVIEDED